MTVAVGYLRVSTEGQGRSGLGLDAQRTAIRNFAESEGYDVVQWFEEIETGRGSDALDRRPQLRAALALARRRKGPVLVSKLDRLSRNVAFVSKLMEEKVPFIVTALGPKVEPFMLHLWAALAEQERTMISQRTRDALAAKRATGFPLGNRTNLDQAQALGRATTSQKAAERAENILPIIEQIKKTGLTALRDIAEALNNRGIRTARSGLWHAQTVARVLERAAGSPPLTPKKRVVRKPGLSPDLTRRPHVFGPLKRKLVL
jgi:DNA invertase Pin-like site-specific DNA recombinase